MKKITTRLIIAASEQDANLYYATKFLAPDPVIFIEHQKKKYLILNDLELDRGRKEANVDHVLSLTEVLKETKKQIRRNPTMMDLVAYQLKKLKAKTVTIPYNFPFAHAEALKKKKIKLEAKGDPFYEERLIKTLEEKNAIKKSCLHIQKAIMNAYEVLKKSKIKGNRIYYESKVLTSERLRSVINLTLMENNCLPKHSIVAGGNQAVDPHCEGNGPLLPHWPIIMDIFPKSMDSQYFGDVTRTVVKGKPSDAVHKLWHTVKHAQEKGIKMVKAGADGQKIHSWINDYFEKQGYPTGVKDGRIQGFFHGTGHGLGLDIHEAPRVSRISEKLKSGMVVTVEPGLYYHGIGGVRIEDDVFVKKDGCEVLSKCKKIFNIP